MRPEWVYWLILQGIEEEKLIEASIIFAVKPSNIQQIPNFKSFLGKMHVIFTLPAWETPIQYT